MASEKKFRTGLFGYKKQDVYEFIEKLAKDLEEQIATKDDELRTLRSKNKELKEKIEELSNKLSQIESDRTYIASAIIRAEEQANNILNNAVKEAEQKKEELQAAIDREKERHEAAKQRLHDLRLSVVDMMKRFEMDLLEMTEDSQNQEETERVYIEDKVELIQEETMYEEDEE